MSWLSRLGDWHSQSTRSEADDRASPEHHQEEAGQHVFDGHLDRNEFQQGLAPDRPHDNFCYVDPHTHIVWEPDDQRAADIWHGGNDCFRGVLPEHTVEDLRADPHYRDAFDQVDAGHGYDVDHTVPGAQVCFERDGALVDTGVHQGTWDYASPTVTDQRWEHWHLDVAPDNHSDNYTDYDPSSHATAVHDWSSPDHSGSDNFCVAHFGGGDNLDYSAHDSFVDGPGASDASGAHDGGCDTGGEHI